MADHPSQPLFVPVPAKINLTLDVLGKRPDGYHDLASVMQSIALYDTLAFWPDPDGRATLDCDRGDLNNSANLALRAAELLAAHTGCRQGVRIELHKVIPAQAGMGGGSSDAAATLVALNRWWHLGLDRATLMTLAAQLGSDVPFFIVGGTALVEGRGELVTALPALPPLWFVVVKPDVAVPTPAVFGALSPAAYTDGSATRRLVAAIEQGVLPPLDDTALVNALEPGVLEHFAPVAAMRELLLAAGAPTVRMSGSGPTLFIPCTSLAEARRLWQVAKALSHDAWLTHPIGAML